MSSRYPSSKAVILLGGHEDRHFRPLSMDQPTPLFPIAGRPMLFHHVEACAKVPNLKEILLIGAYDAGVFANFMDMVMREIQTPIRYLQERQHLGTGGGLRFFRDDIEHGRPDVFFVLHFDICCSFPLVDMFHHHMRAQAFVTVLGKRVFPDEAKTYGCMVADPESSEVVHWAEKPSSFVSDLINCGVYLLNMEMLQDIVEMGDSLADQRTKAQLRSAQYPRLFRDADHVDKLRSVRRRPPRRLLTRRRHRLEQDFLFPMAGTQQLYVFETGDFWCQIKTPGMAVMCSELYMQRYRYVDPTLLASTGGKLSPRIEGNVVVHPSAAIDPTAKLGPNVCIGAGVTIGRGVRVAHSIVLEGVTIRDHACILFSILGWNSTVGEWARIEGEPPNESHRDHPVIRDVTILGVSVHCAPEVIVRNCIVLPRKTLTESCHNQVLL
ncbi:Aste57867_3960 [Aphanomyces stellatus]|uniref:Aste57867_3960 protein n=1 Tax=Aphanomyces stellatus TaxID=120398 RepID=A0A485KCA8_9STRA|nr:hypothetical protein As57867_003949 [Aphanomyces stellatus]VFT81097.1 Aste57867_3960 [Aphanomyces stellatus]